MSNADGFSKTKKVMMGLFEIVIYHLSFLISFYIRYEGIIPTYNYNAYTKLRLYIFIVFIILNSIFGIYILYNKSMIDLVYLTLIIQLVMTFIIMSLTYIGRWFGFPRTILFIGFGVSSLLLIIWRLVIFKLYLRIAGTKEIMVVGSVEKCTNAIRNFGTAKNSRHKITKAVVSNYYMNVKKHADSVDIIYLADDLDEDSKIKIYEYLIKKDKQLFLNTSFENLLLVKPNIMSIEDESLIEISNFRVPPEEQIIKRLIDVVVALIMIVLTSPIMLITVLLVKLTSKGPAIYKQIRITKNQKEFNIYKFRTMSITAEEASGPVLASSNDVRVTKLGKYLRSFRLDELPQLFNVLFGDMSMVGPRPERPFFVEQFNEMNSYYYLRHNVRAGITGYAQVYGKYASDFNSKLNFDLVYIKKYSLLLDIKILFQTVKTLFDKVSSQGLDEDEEITFKIPEYINMIE